jgi:hypothetical protein
MPVLIVAIASFLGFVAIGVLLLIADTLESRAIRHKRDLTLANPMALFSISEAFDPIHSVLWEAPVAALKLTDSAGISGIPAARLRPIYEQAAARFPEIYEGFGFVPWLQLLEETQLISWHGCNVVLTPDGHAFLRFRFVTDGMVEA